MKKVDINQVLVLLGSVAAAVFSLDPVEIQHGIDMLLAAIGAITAVVGFVRTSTLFKKKEEEVAALSAQLKA